MPVDVKERGAGQARPAPGHPAALELHRPQLGVAGVAPARGVEIAAVVDRGAPVQGQALAPPRRIAPDHFVAARADPQQRAARSVALGDEDGVAYHQRRGGVDALQHPRPPGVVEVDRAAGGLEAEQAAAREDEAPAPAADGGQHGAGVAGQLVGDRVAHLAGALVERHHAAAVAAHLAGVDRGAPRWAAAHLQDEQIALDRGRAAGAEEVLHHPEALTGVHLPEQLAVAHLVAAQTPLGPEGVDALAIHQR